MEYKIRIIREGGQEVPITTSPLGSEFTEAGGVVHFCTSWERLRLAARPREILAVGESWPGREIVEVDNGDGQTVFTGLVAGVGWKDEWIFLRARETAS